MQQTMTFEKSDGSTVKIPLPVSPFSICGASFDNKRKIGAIPKKRGPFPERRLHVTLDLCVDFVCMHYGISPKVVYCKTRKYKSSHPRQMVYLLAREAGGIKFDNICAEFKMDRCSVIKGVRSCRKRLLKDDSEYWAYIEMRDSLIGEYAIMKPPTPETKEVFTKTCSCGTTFETTEAYRFCPDCRARIAKMDGGLG